MSSAAVYGNPSTLPVSEGAALAPVSPYGFHKEMAEDILREFHDVYGIRSCAARVFSAYGSGLRRQLLWDVCQKVVAGPIVTLFGTGAETRDFIHVEDVARAIRVLAENAEMNAEVYNVASGHQTTIESVARALVSSLDPQIEVRFSGEQRPGDPLHWEADISAVSGLGFHAQVSFEDGVADYARWFVEENRT
jgi:nucleoside-diphosphate-sugar epimerase